MANITMRSNEYYMIQEVSSVVMDFLKRNGGYPNGYETSVSGVVRPKVHSSLKWSTPKQYDMTVGEVKRLGIELYDAVLKIMEDYECDQTISLVIGSEPIGDVCCNRLYFVVEHRYRFEY